MMAFKMGIPVLSVCFMVSLVMLQASLPVLGSSQVRQLQHETESGHLLVHRGGGLDPRLNPSVGNGYLAHVIDGPAIYIAGVYSGQIFQQYTTKRAMLPNSQSFEINAPELMSLLNVRDGIFQRYYKTNAGCVITQTTYAHRTRPHLLVTSFSLDNTLGSDLCNVTVVSQAMGSSQDLYYLHDSTFTGYAVRTFTTRAGENYDTTLVVVSIAATQAGPMFAPIGSIVEYPMLTVVATTLETRTPARMVRSLYLAALESFHTGSLLEEHVNAWKDIWSSRIEVIGNPKLARIVSSSLYYLHSSIRDDQPWSISPGGLATRVENGQIGWDAEAWMYSPLLDFWSETAANSILGYRMLNLEGAEAKAKRSDWMGAEYPWEAAFTGYEVAPLDSFDRHYSIYLSGQIAVATKKHFYATHDYEWLASMFPMIRKIADFYSSRATSEYGRYYINEVRPVDQYVLVVNNSVYTNYIARTALEWAYEAAQRCHEPVNPLWKTVARGLVLPFDSTNQIHLEYDGYNGTTIQQADVVLLGYPLEMNMGPTIRENDLRYYESRTDPNSPSSTWAMHSIGWLELNDSRRGQSMFDRAAKSAQAPFWVWTKTPSDKLVNYLPNAGAFLQSVINGYGGLRTPKVGARKFKPVLPANTGEIALIGVKVASMRVNVRWNSTAIAVTSTSPFGGLQLALDGREPINMADNKPYYLPYGQEFTVFQPFAR